MQESATKSSAPKRRSVWPLLIIGLLGLHVTGMAIAFAIAQHDRSFLVVPDYYDKAQHWDQARSEELAGKKLGWKLRIEASPHVDDRGCRGVNFVLTDAIGQAVKDASLRVNYFHHAHPDKQLVIEILPDAIDGRRFPATMPMPYRGIWEFHFTATAGGKTYVTTQTEFVLNQ